MTAWDDTGSGMAPSKDYSGLAEALQADWDLLDHHHWRSEIDARSGQRLNGDELDRQVRLAQAVLGEHPAANQVGTATEMDAGAGRLTNPPAQRAQERDRNVWAMRGGIVSRLGWENPNDHRQGYEYRMHVSAPDGTSDVYARMDPNAAHFRIGDQILPRFDIGRYANPTNGASSGPHLHHGRTDAQGNWVDPGSETPVIDGTITRDFRMHHHPVLKIDRMHYGNDVVGRFVTRSDPDLP